MDSLLPTANHTLLLDPRVALLSGRAKASLHRDFAVGRARITFCIRAKLSFWRQIPWVLCGCGHPE
eukprot:7085450-Alexandrium_andersonii.AAC.1